MDLGGHADYRRGMTLDEIQPAHCHALARRLLAESRAIREEMGRSEDTRPVPQITGAQPRECYAEAIALWRKAARLGSELGVQSTRPAPVTPPLADVRPGHVHRLLEGVHAQLEDVKARLGITEEAAELAVEAGRQPSHVLVEIIRINRDLSRTLERPFTPSDVYRTVATASAYATRLGAQPPAVAFERRLQPAHCYAQLEACLVRVAELIGKRGGSVLAVRGTPPDVLPGDVYDLANLLLGELAYLHALTPNAAPLHAFEPEVGGHVLPAHVHQLARTLAAQLTTIQ
jgi:hypothetical protein